MPWAAARVAPHSQHVAPVPVDVPTVLATPLTLTALAIEDTRATEVKFNEKIRLRWERVVQRLLAEASRAEERDAGLSRVGWDAVRRAVNEHTLPAPSKLAVRARTTSLEDRLHAARRSDALSPSRRVLTCVCVAWHVRRPSPRWAGGAPASASRASTCSWTSRVTSPRCART